MQRWEARRQCESQCLRCPTHRCFATAKPMPWLAPVTTAIFFVAIARRFEGRSRDGALPFKVALGEKSSRLSTLVYNAATRDTPTPVRTQRRATTHTAEQRSTYSFFVASAALSLEVSRALLCASALSTSAADAAVCVCACVCPCACDCVSAGACGCAGGLLEPTSIDRTHEVCFPAKISSRRTGSHMSSWIRI